MLAHQASPKDVYTINPTNMSEKDMSYLGQLLEGEYNDCLQKHNFVAVIKDQVTFPYYLYAAKFTHSILYENGKYSVINDENQIMGTIQIENQKAIYAAKEGVLQDQQDQKNGKEKYQSHKKLIDKKSFNKHFHFPKFFARKNENKNKNKNENMHKENSERKFQFDDFETQMPLSNTLSPLEIEQLEFANQLKDYASHLYFEMSSHCRFNESMHELNINAFENFLSGLNKHILSLNNFINKLNENSLKDVLGFEPLEKIESSLVVCQAAWAKYVKEDLIFNLDSIFIDPKFSGLEENRFCSGVIKSLKGHINDCDFNNTKVEDIFKMLSGKIQYFTEGLIQRSLDKQDEYKDYICFSENLIQELSKEYIASDECDAIPLVTMKR